MKHIQKYLQRGLYAALLLGLLAVSAASASAQGVTCASLFERVKPDVFPGRILVYGTAYEASTDNPLGKATYTLLNTATGTTADTKTLNPQIVQGSGGYAFYVQPGSYRLVVSQVGYTFPTSAGVDSLQYMDQTIGNAGSRSIPFTLGNDLLLGNAGPGAIRIDLPVRYDGTVSAQTIVHADTLDCSVTPVTSGSVIQDEPDKICVRLEKRQGDTQLRPDSIQMCIDGIQVAAQVEEVNGKEYIVCFYDPNLEATQVSVIASDDNGVDRVRTLQIEPNILRPAAPYLPKTGGNSVWYYALYAAMALIIVSGISYIVYRYGSQKA